MSRFKGLIFCNHGIPLLCRALSNALLTCTLAVGCACQAWALDWADLPAGPVNDAIMASPAETAEIDDWVGKTLAVPVTAQPAQRATAKLIHQDHNELRFGQSIMLSPLCIGRQEFKHGLGTHANSEIAIGVPAAAAKFQCWVGIDDNPNTRSAMKSSVQFVVEIAGKDVLRTKTLRCRDLPVAVDIQIPPGTNQILLKTVAMVDGAGWDHADWADARFVTADGRMWQLDETRGPPSLIPAAGLPFSFAYGGKSSSELLKTWSRTIDTKESPMRHDTRRLGPTPPQGCGCRPRLSSTSGSPPPTGYCV